MFNVKRWGKKEQGKVLTFTQALISPFLYIRYLSNSDLIYEKHGVARAQGHGCVSCVLYVVYCLTPNSPQPRFGKADHRKKESTDIKSIQLVIESLSVVCVHPWFLLVILGIVHL